MEFPKFPSPEEIKSAAQDMSDNARKVASNIAEQAASVVGDIATHASSVAGQALDATVGVASSAAEAITTTAGNVVSAAASTIDDQINKHEAAKEEKIRMAEEVRMRQIDSLEIDNAKRLLESLGDSPIPTTEDNTNKVKDCFPLPKEQDVLWIDVEFDLRPSGIIATNKGVFIKSDAVVFALPFSDYKECETTSKLTFIPWQYFEPESFTSEDEENCALSVNENCSKKFIAACKYLTSIEPISMASYDVQASYETHAKENITAAAGAAAVISSETALFAEQNASVNTPGGHGFMAEDANTIIDRFLGHDAEVVGNDFAKNGADRRVDGVLIQTKYYKSARSTLESSFDHGTGLYRYIDKTTNEPMQLEVPSDQYDSVLKHFEEKIRDGKVPGVTDPAKAKELVRKGNVSYEQAVNLTKPGTIESLLYDAKNGAVVCSCAFGISFVVATYNAYRKTNDLDKSVQAGITAGVQVFGISFVQHMLVSQIARTNAAKMLMQPSQFLIEKLGSKATQGLVNSIRALSGKTAIYGSAASKQLARIFRSNVITTAITLAVFSVPETYSLANRRISAAQYAKNISSITGSVVGGAGGAIAAGAIASKVAGAAGTAVAPGVGTAIGIAGGFIGGAAGAAASNAIGDILHEGDAANIGRLLNAYVSCMSIEYMLNETELGDLTEELDKITSDEFKDLFASFLQSEEQENLFREFLTPRFETVIAKREPFKLPDEQSIDDALSDILASIQSAEG